jgi:ABC-type transport system involved in cytochrome c biogenesis permease subunit
MDGHELNSVMLYIHPPLAITGYVLTFLFVVLIFKKKWFEAKTTKITGAGMWFFTFLGLLTGMLWAQLSWGSYWSWDPKETSTLALFLTVSASQVMYFEKKYAMSKWLVLISCVLTVITALSSFITPGLHSFS